MYMRDLFEHGPDKIAVLDMISEAFNRFREIISADEAILRFHELLSDEFKAHKEGEHNSTRSQSNRAINRGLQHHTRKHITIRSLK